MKMSEFAARAAVVNLVCAVTTLVAYCQVAEMAQIVKTVGSALFAALAYSIFKIFALRNRLHKPDGQRVFDDTAVGKKMMTAYGVLPPVFCVFAVFALLVLNTPAREISWIIIVLFCQFSINLFNFISYKLTK